MHSAPSVTYPVGRSPFAGALLLVLWLAAAGVIAWWWRSGASGWRLGAAVLVCVVTGLWAGLLWWRSPSGAVAWDGQSWNWAGEGAADTGVLEVGLDLQRSMLVRWAGHSASRWFWLERARRAERWDDLRRAVYSRAAAAAPPAHGRPTTKP